MSKKQTKDDPVEKARRKLARAQLKLSAAQDEHAQERVRGQQEIERARLRAAKWLAKAAQRVEKRTEQVAQAEADLQSAIVAAAPPGLLDGGPVESVNGAEPMPATAQAAADLIEEHVAVTPPSEDPPVVQQARPRGKKAVIDPTDDGADPL